MGDGHAASSETRAAGGAERRRRFATELRKILEGGRDSSGSKGGRTGLIEVASGAVGVLSRACIGEMQVMTSRNYERRRERFDGGIFIYIIYLFFWCIFLTTDIMFTYTILR